MTRPLRLLLMEPTGTRREVPVHTTPFRIGRQADNQLALRDSRISRQQAQIVSEDGRLILEDLGSRPGTFVNGQRIERHELRPRDIIDFGIPDSYRLVYLGEEATLDDLIHRVESAPPVQAGSRELYHLGLLLEVARTLHTGMALEDVLTAVVDAAMQVTRTERGILLLTDPAGRLEPAVARNAARRTLSAGELEISSGVLRQVTQSRRELIVSDVGDDSAIASQASVVRMALRTVVAIPLEKLPMMASLDTTVHAQPSELLGVLYLDSHSPGSAFSDLDREVLRSLAQDAATVIENARLFAAARAKERLDHEMQIAAEIQQRLLPKIFPSLRFCKLAARNLASHTVGGDYFDLFLLPGGRLGFVVADVAGKGISAALLASMLQGVFLATAEMDLPLAETARRVNRYLCERSLADRYATLFYGVLGADGQLDYLNAGHCPPLLRRAEESVMPLAAENYPVGMFEDADYRAGGILLNPSDSLLIYTDGVTEARNHAGEFFGEEALQAIAGQSPGSSPEELAVAVLEAVQKFTAGAPQSDDITLLVVQYSG